LPGRLYRPMNSLKHVLLKQKKQTENLIANIRLYLEFLKKKVKRIASQILTIIVNRDKIINALIQIIFKFNARDHPI
jgi:hypothetical protein